MILYQITMKVANLELKYDVPSDYDDYITGLMYEMLQRMERVQNESQAEKKTRLCKLLICAFVDITGPHHSE